MIEFAGVGLSTDTDRLNLLLRAWWHEDRILYADHPGHLTAGLAHLPRPFPPRREAPTVARLNWPCQHASRWATMFHLVGQDQLARIRAALSPSMSVITNGPAPLTITDGRLTSVQADMYLLPPRAIAQRVAGEPQAGELYLLELVDERYYWWAAGDQHAPDPTNATWAGHIGDLFALIGLSPTIDTIPANYDPPDPDRWRVGFEPIPLQIDAACRTVGCRVVRTPAGAVSVRRWTNARADQDAQVLALEADRKSGGRLAASDIGKAVPAAVAVVFSNDPGTIEVRTLAAFGGIGGANGVAARTGLVRADLSSSASGSARSNWADEAGLDYYRWQQSDWEAEYRGLVVWVPTGVEDSVEWDGVYTGDDAMLVRTRVRRPPEFDANVYGGAGASGGGGLFFAKITGNDGGSPRLYSAVEIDLRLADPELWITKPGGTTIPQWKGHRAPSKDYDDPTLPFIPTGQAVLARPSATKPGHFMLTPWGGQLRVNEKELVLVCVRCIEQVDGTFKLRTRSVYRHMRRDARDQRRTLGLNTDPETAPPCTDC